MGHFKVLTARLIHAWVQYSGEQGKGQLWMGIKMLHACGEPEEAGGHGKGHLLLSLSPSRLGSRPSQRTPRATIHLQAFATTSYPQLYVFFQTSMHGDRLYPLLADVGVKSASKMWTCQNGWE